MTGVKIISRNLLHFIKESVCFSKCKSFTPTDEELEDEEKAKEDRDRWRSIYVIYVSSFIGCLSYSLYLTSIWPYLRSLDPSADKGFLGWVAMMYSFTQMIASPLIGEWANRMQQVRMPIIITLITNCMGHLMYTALEALPGGPDFERKYALLVVRVIVGISGAGSALFRSYISQATTLKEKTGSQAIVSACQALGMILGPAVQSALVSLMDYGIKVPQIAFYMDMYTAPGWLAFILGTANVFLLIFFFHEHNMAGLDPDVNDVPPEAGPRNFRKHSMVCKRGCFKWNFFCCKKDSILPIRRSNESEVTDSESGSIKLPTYKTDKIALGVCLLIIFVSILCSNTMETVATPLCMDLYAWSEQKAIQHVGQILALGAIISFVSTLLVAPLAKRIDERKLLVGLGFVAMLIGFIICYPWGSNLPILQGQYNFSSPGNVLPERIGDYNLTVVLPTDLLLRSYQEVNSTNCAKKRMMARLTSAAVGLSSTSTSSPTTSSPDLMLGCPLTQPWCHYTPITEEEQFIAGYLLFSVGYAVSVAIDFGLYSKILGTKPQGAAMGIMSSVGSLSRTCGPLLVGQLYTHLGPRVLFATLGVTVSLCLVVIVIFYRRLVPWQGVSSLTSVRTVPNQQNA